MRSFPGALTRARRNRAALATMLLAGLVGVAGAGMQSTGAILLQNTLDDHWRGAYDILVTATPQQILAHDGIDFVPDETSSRRGDDTMSLKQLAAVRALAGVAIAAPLGQMAVPAQSLQSPVQLTVPLDGSVPGWAAYAVTTVETTTDGVTKPTTITRTLTYVLDQSAFTGYAAEVVPSDPNAPDTIARTRAASARGSGIAQSTDAAQRIDPDRYLSHDTSAVAVVTTALPISPVQNAQISLIDPVAEKRLLGDDGAFLDPLIATSGDINTDPTGSTPDVAALRKGDDLATLQSKGVLQNVAPVLTRSDSSLDAHLTVSIRTLKVAGGDPSKLIGTWTLTSRPKTTAVGPSTKLFDDDIGPELSPFATRDVAVDWPGFTLPQQPWYANLPEIALAAPGLPAITAETTSAPPYKTGPTLPAAGYSNPWKYGGTSLETAKPDSPASDAAYLSTLTDALDPNAVQSTNQRPWSVGTYSAADLHGTIDDLSYEALGYDELAPVYGGTAVKPSASGLGLNPDAADAIADISNAASWGLTDPVSSIRVRVGGVTRFDAVGLARMRTVAAEIRSLGLTATIVAGSSPQSVPIAVTGYATQAADANNQHARATVADLGTISRDWAGLGAAQSAQLGVPRAALATLLLAAVAASAMLVTVQLGSIPGRRSETALLRQIGWTRRQRVAWIAREEAIAVGLLAVLGAIAVVVATYRDIVFGISAATTATALVIGVVAVVAGSGTSRPRTASRARRVRLVVRSIRTFAARQAISRWSVSLVTLLSTAFLGATAGFAVVSINATRTLAGSSRLGIFAITQSLGPQSILLAITAVAGIAIITVSRRRDAERDATVIHVLVASGWSRRDIARSRALSLALAAVPGLVIALAVIDRVSPPAVLVLSLPATVVGAAIAWFTAFRPRA